MKLTYFGHCAFRWETPGGLTVMADPYRNQADRYWFTRLFPDVHCDLGLITHAHFDHDAADRLPELASVLRTPGDFSVSDLQIRGIRDLHSGASRLRDFPNVMFRLEVDGLVERLQPKVVIPMHYFIPGLSASGNDLMPPEQWLERQPAVSRLDSHHADFSAESLPGSTEVWLFRPALESLSAPEVGPAGSA